MKDWCLADGSASQGWNYDWNKIMWPVVLKEGCWDWSWVRPEASVTPGRTQRPFSHYTRTVSSQCALSICVASQRGCGLEATLTEGCHKDELSVTPAWDRKGQSALRTQRQPTAGVRRNSDQRPDCEGRAWRAPQSAASSCDGRLLPAAVSSAPAPE